MFIFYRQSKTLNGSKKFNAQSIFVSNHPSAFIDPLVIGNFQKAIIYFVTRGDIFKPWLHPVTWASHMVPIFRKEQDGADSHEKNKDSFLYLRKTLLRKKSLLLFGEGYTDDIFIRSLKGIKKGPARIGFDTMVSCNWEDDIRVHPLGINYSHPKYFRSSILLSFGEPIHLKDYKEIYEENPSKAITQLTRAIQKSMQEQITYVENKELAPFVENILILSRKGMNYFHVDRSVKLEDRFRYSQATANKVNAGYSDDDEKWTGLRSRITSYFERLKKAGINENWVHRFGETGKKSTVGTFILFTLLSPIILLGLVHQALPYLLIKRFVENTFKRDVFWSGVKLLVGAVLSTVYNILLIIICCLFFECPDFWITLIYFLTIPVLSGTIAYVQIRKLKDTLAYSKVSDKKLAAFVSERQALLDELKSMDLV